VSLWCLSLTVAAPAHAQNAGKAAKVANPTKELSVHARAIERPLMKYRLFPAEYELREGNAAPILLRFPWEHETYFSKIVRTFSDYLELPLTDPKLRNAGDVFTPLFYRELKRAAYRRTADWEYPIGEWPAAEILLPDAQGARAITGRGLSVWIRHKISHGKLAEAREGILVGLAVTRHYARAPFVVSQLIAAATDSMMLDRLDELVAQPNCPNLYWALTALPRPIVDLRPSIELEQRFLDMSVSGIDHLDQLQTEDQWMQRIDRVMDLFLDPAVIGKAKTNRKQIFDRLAKHARADLPGWIEGGAARVSKMSDAEAALRWFLHAHEGQAQEVAAFMCLEPASALPRLAALQKGFETFRLEAGLPSLFVLEKPLNVYIAIHRQQRRIDALRIVEAVRDYAATHDAHLPESLDKIVDVPIPNDLFSGKPFHYEIADGAAILSAPGIFVDGEDRGAIRYRIKVEK
jgi:hypothetical protein